MTDVITIETPQLIQRRATTACPSAIPPAGVRGPLPRLSDGLACRRVQRTSMTGQEHIGIERGQRVERQKGLFPVVTEDARHQSRAGAIREDVSIDEGITGDDDSAVGKVEGTVAARMPGGRDRHRSAGNVKR